jgi:transposase
LPPAGSAKGRGPCVKRSVSRTSQIIAERKSNFRESTFRGCMKSGPGRVFRYSIARMRKRYPTDLSDAEWKYIEPHLPAPKGYGRPRTHSLREILNAIFYPPKSGCQWRLLPHDFPRWPTAYHCFRTWRINGTWERINRALRERLRVRSRRDPKPSAGVVDSQSVKSTAVCGEERGYDGAKKVKGSLSATSW